MGISTQHIVRVTAHEITNITLVNIQGSLSSTTSAQGIQDLQRVLDRGARKLVINLAELDYISSAGLHMFLILSKRLRHVQGELKISNAKGMVHESFGVSGVNAMIQLCDTDEDAVAAFKAPMTPPG